MALLNPSPHFTDGQAEARAGELLGQRPPVGVSSRVGGCSLPRLSVPSSLQYEPIITKGNEALVHHMEVFQCAAEFESVPRFSGPCDSKMKPDRLNYCRHVLAAWALGAKVRALCSRVTSRASSRVFGGSCSSTPLCPPLLYLKGHTKGHWGCS